MRARATMPLAAAAVLAVIALGCGGSGSSSFDAGVDAPKTDTKSDVINLDSPVDRRVDGAGEVGGDAPRDAAASDASNDASADSGGRDVGAPPCFLDLTPLSEPKFDDFERSLMPFRVRATPSINQDGDLWAWRIDNADGSILTTPAKVDGDPKTVEFPIQVTGLYHITVSISSRPACGQVSYPLRIIDPLPAKFVFRVFPPASLAVPVQEFSRTREQLAQPLALDSQIQPISIFAYDNGGHILPTYLQITSPATPLVVQGNTANGQVRVPLLQDRTYDLLLIPDLNAPFAPKLVSGQPSDLDDPNVRFDPGIAVTGQTLRSDDSSVVDARVVLRQGIRPSTIGKSTTDGTFSLFTREGTMSVEIDAPLDSGLPDVHVASGDGITLGRDASGLMLTMRWAELEAGALHLTVHNSDGTAVAAGAAVHLELTDPPDPAGQLTVHSLDAPAGTDDVILSVTGSLRADAVTGSQGTATFPALTAGHYLVTVRPNNAGDPAAAITVADADVTAAGATVDVRLAHKVRLSGVVQAASGASKGVRVTAIDTGTDVVSNTLSAEVDDGGAYTLSVDPGRIYKLWALPAAGQPFARTFLAQQTAPAADQTLPPFMLPVGVPTAGNVSATVPVPGALVQVYCPPLSTSCLDASLPLAEAVTDGKGNFIVTLPSFDSAGPSKQ